MSRTKTRLFFDPNSRQGHNIHARMRDRLKDYFASVGEPRKIEFDGYPALCFDRFVTDPNQTYHIILMLNRRYVDFTVRDALRGTVTILKIEAIRPDSHKWWTYYTV